MNNEVPIPYRPDAFVTSTYTQLPDGYYGTLNVQWLSEELEAPKKKDKGAKDDIEKYINLLQTGDSVSQLDIANMSKILKVKNDKTMSLVEELRLHPDVFRAVKDDFRAKYMKKKVSKGKVGLSKKADNKSINNTNKEKSLSQEILNPTQDKQPKNNNLQIADLIVQYDENGRHEIPLEEYKKKYWDSDEDEYSDEINYTHNFNGAYKPIPVKGELNDEQLLLIKNYEDLKKYQKNIGYNDALMETLSRIDTPTKFTKIDSLGNPSFDTTSFLKLSALENEKYPGFYLSKDKNSASYVNDSVYNAYADSMRNNLPGEFIKMSTGEPYFYLYEKNARIEPEFIWLIAKEIADINKETLDERVDINLLVNNINYNFDNLPYGIRDYVIRRLNQLGVEINDRYKLNSRNLLFNDTIPYNMPIMPDSAAYKPIPTDSMPVPGLVKYDYPSISDSVMKQYTDTTSKK